MDACDDPIFDCTDEAGNDFGVADAFDGDDGDSEDTVGESVLFVDTDKVVGSLSAVSISDSPLFDLGGDNSTRRSLLLFFGLSEKGSSFISISMLYSGTFSKFNESRFLLERRIALASSPKPFFSMPSNFLFRNSASLEYVVSSPLYCTALAHIR